MYMCVSLMNNTQRQRRKEKGLKGKHNRDLSRFGTHVTATLRTIDCHILSK